MLDQANTTVPDTAAQARDTVTEIAALAIRDIVHQIEVDDAGKIDVKAALEHLFEKAGYHLEWGAGFAYAEAV